MRAISVDLVSSGMVVARSIYGTNGETLLAKGVSLNENYISRLKEMGISSLYVTSDTMGDIEVEDVINEQTRLETKKLTKEAMSDIKTGAKLNVKKVNEVIDNLIEEIMSNKNLLVCLVDIRAMNDNTFAHSVNVAVLSVVTGLALGYPRPKLKQLAVGALFHDIGKVLISENLLVTSNHNKETEELSEEFKNHTKLGFQVLKKSQDISLLSAHVALQHHERIDGQGYPRGLNGPEINEYAKITAIADAYDNLISDHTGQEPLSSQHAIEYLTLNSEIRFDPDVIKAFIKNVAAFPVGTLVMLNMGEKGIVTKVNKNFPTRPMVRILKDAQGRSVKPPYEIDLMEAHSYFLTKVISDEEL